MIDILSAVLRALSFVLQFQAAGAVFFTAAFGPALTISMGNIRALAKGSALTAVVVVALHYLLEAGRMSDDLSGVMDASLQTMAWSSSLGGAFSVRMLGLLLIVAGMQTTSVRLTTERLAKTMNRGTPPLNPRSPMFWVKQLSSQGSNIAAVGGAVLVAASFTLTGHTTAGSWRWLLAPLLLCHLLIVAFWFGSLWPLYLVTQKESRERMARVVSLFSAAAFWLVPLILFAGVAMTVLLLPSVNALWKPYGELLITKIVLFAVLMGLAAFNKWRFGPKLAQTGDLAAPGVFRVAVIVEFAIIVAVMAVTAVLTTFYSPD